jgi:hypothetical protein
MPSTRRTSLVKRNESSTGRRSSNASSDGSCVQPSIGIPFTVTYSTRWFMTKRRPKKVTHSHSRYSKSVNCRRGKFAKDLAQRVRDPWCMTRLVAGYRTVSKRSGENPLSTKMGDVVARTSRKNLRPRMSCPASSQSITGSAYSFIDAVKITSVYQADT